MDVRVQAEAFDAGAELNAFSLRAVSAGGVGASSVGASSVGAGAVVSFTGIVRDVDGGLQHMQIEHYPGMTQKAISGLAQQAVDRWSLSDVLVIHRYGNLAPGAQIMMVATASPHRAGAFTAADFLMDYLKSRAPFWKKEVTTHGADWVAAKDADEDALNRW